MLFATSSLPVSAQITTVTAEQAPPIPGAGHDFIKLFNETVSPAVGSVDIHIDAGAPTGRGITPKFAIGYDSNSARHFNNGTPVAFDNGGYLAQGGWRYIVPELEYTLTVQQVLQPGGTTPQNCDSIFNYILTDFGGTLHPLGISSGPALWPGCNGQSQSWVGTISQNGDGVVTATTTPLNPTPAASPQAPPVIVFNQDGMLYSFSNAFGRTHNAGKYWFLTAGGNNIPAAPTALSGMPDVIEDRNGNQIVYNDDDKNLASSGAFHITDTVGRTAVTASSFGNPNGDSIAISGLSNPVTLSWGTATFNWSYNAHIVAPPISDFWVCSAPSGATTTHIGGASAATADAQGIASGSGPVVTALGLPNDLSYQFLYDNPNGDNPFGLLRKIIYPNGAYVRYTWELNPASTPVMYAAFNTPPSPGMNPPPPNPAIACEAIVDTPAVAKRFVSFDGLHEVQEQDFSYSTTWTFTNNNVGGAYQMWTQKQTTVVTKDLVTNTNSKTIYTFVPIFDFALGNDFGIGQATGVFQNHPGEKTILYEDGSGKVLQTVTKGGVMNEFVPPQNVLTTLDNGLSSLSRTDYKGTVVTDEYQYDFGTTVIDSVTNANPFPLGPHGPLLQHIHADYNHAFPLNPLMPPVTTTTPMSTAISDRPSDVITYDGNENRMAESDYCYDGDTSSFTGCGSSSLASASATGHDDTNFSTGFVSGRGNATTKIMRCFSGASQTACSQGDSVTVYSYDQTGQQTSKKDPNHNTTSYSFADSFFDPTPPINATAPPGNTNTYITKITYPTTNGVSHVENFSYAYSDGSLTVLSDENGNQSKYTYNDSLRRLTESDFPDGGETTLTYNDSGANPNVVTNKKIDSGHILVTTEVADGMGHPIQHQLNSDPAGVDYTDITYDGLGRAISGTNPHRSSSAPTDGVTQTAYDALGRVIQVTKQDGSVSSVSYVANCSIALDEVGRRQRSCHDSLGRLVEVDEPTPGTSETMSATNATATVSLSGNLESKPSSNPATGTVTISGTDSIVPGTSAYDFGTVTVTIGNAPVSAPYGNNGSSPSVASDVASALCTQITNTSSTNTQVSCSTSGTVINLTAQAPGTAGNGIALQVSAHTQNPQSNQSAFASSSTSGSLSGGGTPIYDSGATKVTISGRGYNVSWSGSTTTASSIASSLASAINSDPAGFATASASGSTITITANDVGMSGNNISLACATTYDAGDFGAPSFSIACPASLSGGHEAGSLSAPMVTLYSYDALNDLLQVSQQGGTTDQIQWRIRTFTYNSLSHLLTAVNPESGHISYVYDANGNMLQKISPAPNQPPGSTATQTTSYCYDALNRITDKSYTPQPPANGQPCPLQGIVVNTGYDSGTNGIGHLTGLTDQAGSGSYSYETMGRISGERRTIAGISKSMSYLYNLDGSIQKLTYPSGAAITYTPDPAGRTGAAQDLGNNLNYVTGTCGPGSNLACYDPTSELSSFLSGASSSFAGISNSFSFNNRLQPVNMAAVAPNSSDATASVTISGALNGVGSADIPGAGSPLSSYRDGNGGGHLFFIDGNNHVIHVSVQAGGPSQAQDVTALSAGPPAIPSSQLASFDNLGSAVVIYQGTNQHIYGSYYNGSSWITSDYTAMASTSVVGVAGTPLAAYLNAPSECFFYLGTDSHVYELLWNGSSMSNLDLTTLSGGPTAISGSKLSSFNNVGNAEVIYQGANQHVYGIYYNGSAWTVSDYMALASTTVVGAAGTSLTAYLNAPSEDFFYLDTSNHLDELFWNGSSMSNQDLTALSGGPPAMSGSKLSSFNNVGNSVVVYQGSNQHIYGIYFNGSNWTDSDYTAMASTTIVGAPGTALTSFLNSPSELFFYQGSNNHVYDAYWNGSSMFNLDITPNGLSDSGTVQLAIGGFSATACFGPSTNTACNGQSGNSTTAQVASALVAALNVSGSPVTATASGATINMTWKATGPFTTPVAALSTRHDNPDLFPNPSFTSPATSFSGGGPITVFSLNYDFHAGNGDNGNVFGITNNRDTSRSQSFTYDALNRLISAQNTGTDCSQTTVNPNQTKFWGNNYVYDRWGNLLQKNPTKCKAESLTVIAAANNQIHTGNPPAQNQACASSPDYLYDAAGNMTCNLSGNLTPQSYSYDAENRITGAGGYTYTYDADGNRIEKSNGSTGTIYWYMSPGIVAESDLSGNLKSEYVFFDGERVARKDFSGSTTSVFYYFSDHLKTASVITDSAGTIKEDEDYYPWGGELQFVNNDSNHYKFTSKERDSETGLDYFGARYYGNWLGRFVTPDWSSTPVPVPYANLSDPQSLNQYSYTRNLPTSKADQDGHLADFIPRVWEQDCGIGCKLRRWLGAKADEVRQEGESPGSGFEGDTSAPAPVRLSNEVAENGPIYIAKAMSAGLGMLNIADVSGLGSVAQSLMMGEYTGDRKSILASLAFMIPLGGEAKEAVTVYRIVEDGKTVYVGITNNLARRELEQGTKLVPIIGDLTRNEARGVEQALINRYGLAKNGGVLRNKINSISPTKNPGFYNKAVTYGKAVLDSIGYRY